MNTQLRQLALFMLIACATCFAQSTYKGLTPGKSTRAEVEGVLGLPKSEVSETLIEYTPREDVSRLYVQYGGKTPTAIAERIELICGDFDTARNDHCEMGEVFKFPDGVSLSRGSIGTDALTDNLRKSSAFLGPPAYVVKTDFSAATEKSA